VTLEQLPVPEGADRKDGEGLFTGCVVIGQRGMALNYKRADLDEILGRNSSP